VSADPEAIGVIEPEFAQRTGNVFGMGEDLDKDHVELSLGGVTRGRANSKDRPGDQERGQRHQPGDHAEFGPEDIPGDPEQDGEPDAQHGVLRFGGNHHDGGDYQQYGILAAAPAQDPQIQHGRQDQEQVRRNVHIKGVEIAGVGEIAKHEQSRRRERHAAEPAQTIEQRNKQPQRQQEQAAVDHAHEPDVETAILGDDGIDGEHGHDQQKLGRGEAGLPAVLIAEKIVGVGVLEFVRRPQAKTAEELAEIAIVGYAHNGRRNELPTQEQRSN
jgi:hypothetical protein